MIPAGAAPYSSFSLYNTFNISSPEITSSTIGIGPPRRFRSNASAPRAMITSASRFCDSACAVVGAKTAQKSYSRPFPARPVSIPSAKTSSACSFSSSNGANNTIRIISFSSTLSGDATSFHVSLRLVTARCNNHTICSAHYQALSVYFEQPEKFYFVGEGIILSVLLFGMLPAL